MQRADALLKANRIRSERAALRASIHAGHKTATEIITTVPGYVTTMRVEKLLLSVPHLGARKVGWALRVCKIASNKTIGGLSIRQRTELLRWLEGR